MLKPISNSHWGYLPVRNTPPFAHQPNAVNTTYRHPPTAPKRSSASSQQFSGIKRAFLPILAFITTLTCNHPSGQAEAVVPEDPSFTPTVTVGNASINDSSLYRLSKKSGLTVDELQHFNTITDARNIPKNTLLYFPEPPYHVVKPGETLYSIARQWSSKPDEWVTKNNVANPDKIHPSDTLYAPLHVWQRTPGQSMEEIAANINMSPQLLSSLNENNPFKSHYLFTTNGSNIQAPTVVKPATQTPTEKQQPQLFERLPVIGIIPDEGKWNACRGNKCSRRHKGLDFYGPEFSPIVAPSGGKISYINLDEKKGSLGVCIKTEHKIGDDTYQIIYGHLSKDTRNLGLKTGAEIKTGEIIGFIGDTGNAKGGHSVARVSTGGHTFYHHSHVQVYKNGQLIDPTGLLPEEELKNTDALYKADQKGKDLSSGRQKKKKSSASGDELSVIIQSSDDTAPAKRKRRTRSNRNSRKQNTGLAHVSKNTQRQTLQGTARRA